MKGKVDYSPTSQRDLDGIWLYLAREADIDTAARFTGELVEVCETIALSPQGFRPRPEIVSDLRSYPHKRYVIFYYARPGGIVVARILHASRDIENIFTG